VCAHLHVYVHICVSCEYLYSICYQEYCLNVSVHVCAMHKQCMLYSYSNIHLVRYLFQVGLGKKRPDRGAMVKIRVGKM